MANPLLATGLRLGLVVSLLDPVVALDLRVKEAVQAARPTPFERVMQLATDSGRHEVVYGLLLGVAVFTGTAGPATARECLLATIPSSLMVDIVKRVTNRTRPDGDQKRSNASFPSSHAAGAFALATVFSRRWKRLAPAFFAYAVLVACSRIYLNRHFLSDVVVGAMIGFGWAYAVGLWVAERERKRAGKSP